MAARDGRRSEPTGGRQQDESLTANILAATSELLFERGYDNLRVQEIADRAGAGTGAIYRRWETKEALVAEAIREGPNPTPSFPITDDPVADLVAHVRGKAELAAQKPDLLPGLLAAMRANPLIDSAMRQRYTIEPTREVLARVLGDDHAQLDLLAELIPAVALHRATLLGTSIDPEAYADEVLALIENSTGLPLSTGAKASP